MIKNTDELQRIEQLLKTAINNNSTLLKMRLPPATDLLVLDSQNCVQDAHELIMKMLSESTVPTSNPVTNTLSITY